MVALLPFFFVPPPFCLPLSAFPFLTSCPPALNSCLFCLPAVLPCTIAAMSERPVRPPRAEAREVVELKQLRAAQPELASAVDMQIALLDVQRRVQSRVPLPWIQMDPEWQRAQQAAGRPLVRFKDIPLEWSDFRLTLRQTADILQRFDARERADHDRIVGFAREGNALEPLVAAWYNATSKVDGDVGPKSSTPPDAPASLDHVLVLALRPFLARCAEALSQRADVAA